MLPLSYRVLLPNSNPVGVERFFPDRFRSKSRSASCPTYDWQRLPQKCKEIVYKEGYYNGKITVGIHAGK